MEGHLEYATPPTSWHQSHWWKSPRWIVNRIEALVVVAIIISFLLVAFGSCRRWSNRWIIQKGFFAAQVLSLSLGTYSIGLMQSSSVKSEMYPIWTVSLFTLFGCIDPVTTYNGLDYKGPLSKVIYGICLNCGYVLLMSISSISNVIGNASIITLSAISFIKGFHRSFALVQQNRTRHSLNRLEDSHAEACLIRKEIPQCSITIDFMTYVDMQASRRNNKDKRIRSCYDAWVALYLSLKLQKHILGLEYRVPHPEALKGIDYEWAFKVIEIELAFVYDAFFTGNPFHHFYQAKTASFWALSSFTGICFVMVATAIPGGTTRRSGASGCTKVVDTTTADLAITFAILLTLALLQLTQLFQSWTSNWARAAVGFRYSGESHTGWIGLKVFVATSTNLLNRYLWQDKISQYSMLPQRRLLTGRERKCELKWARLFTCWRRREGGRILDLFHMKMIFLRLDLIETLGLYYITDVIWELLSSDTNKRSGVKLDEDVKGSVIEFLGQIQSDQLDRNWLSSLPEQQEIRHFLPHFRDPKLLTKPGVHCYRYTSCVMTWHIVTWYCELAEQKKRQNDALMRKQAEQEKSGRETAVSYYLRKAAAVIPRPGYCFQRRRRAGEGTKSRDHRHVANALSQYCVYLVRSSPELLPGPVAWTRRVYKHFGEAQANIYRNLAKMSDDIVRTDWYDDHFDDFQPDGIRPHYQNGKALAKLLIRRYGRDETWKTLALVWVQLLVYAAPYGNAEAHMRRLSQGGEFITHLWALLYHLDIREWKVVEPNNLHDISTIADAQRTLNDSDHDLDIVVFFASPDRLQEYQDQFVTASSLINDVKFYLTSSPDVADFLKFSAASISEGVDILFLNNMDKKSTFFDSQVYTLNDDGFARFLCENKLASTKARSQERAPSTSHNPMPIVNEKQSSEGHTVVEIEEEIPRSSPPPSS